MASLDCPLRASNSCLESVSNHLSSVPAPPRIWSPRANSDSKSALASGRISFFDWMRIL